MTQNIKTIVSNDSLEVMKSLEKIRNTFHGDVKPGLYYETISLYLVNFCVRYSMLLHELVEREIEESDTADVYKTIIGIQGDSRYLFELFLMTCYFFNQPQQKREMICVSLRLSELLHTHKQDKIIDDLNSNNDTQSKLYLNNKTYRNILILAEECGVKELPEDINSCYRNPIESAGLIYYRNAKINYREEWENNTEVKSALNAVRDDFEKISQPLYALFSLYEHPSYASVEKLNDFIKLSLRKRLEKIEYEKFQILSMIKPIAEAMETSCKKNLVKVK